MKPVGKPDGRRYLAAMLTPQEIDGIVNGAALAALNKRSLKRVFSEPTLDSDGKQALHVVVVVDAKSVSEIDGDQALDAIFSINRKLTEAGESRFAIIDFATEEELRGDGDRQS